MMLDFAACVFGVGCAGGAVWHAPGNLDDCDCGGGVWGNPFCVDVWFGPWLVKAGQCGQVSMRAAHESNYLE
jgi:hypothetical protein